MEPELSQYPTRSELRRWARSVAASARPLSAAEMTRRRRYRISPVAAGASVFLFGRLWRRWH